MQFLHTAQFKHNHLLALSTEDPQAPASGELQIKLVINLNGEVHQISQGNSDLWDQALTSCSVDAIRDLRFAKTESTNATSGNYTFSFTSSPPEAKAP